MVATYLKDTNGTEIKFPENYANRETRRKNQAGKPCTNFAHATGIKKGNQLKVESVKTAKLGIGQYNKSQKTQHPHLNK
jgi:hypothetical protein